MPIRIALNHVTSYRYERPVALSPQVARLRPAPHCRTPILSYSLKVKPDKHFLNWQQDPQGNYLARLVFPDRTKELRFEVDLIAEMAIINPFDFFVDAYAEQFPFEYDPLLRHELEPYLACEPTGPLLADYLRSIDRAAMRSVNFLVKLNSQLQQDIRYLIRLEPGIQTCEETLSLRSGSCRDTTWLLVQLLRHLGLATRFVSGYLVQLTPDVKSLDGPSGTDHDFTDLHAWAEVYLPGAGWIGLDPTSGLFAGEGHIPLACSPDPTSAAPITGMAEQCETQFDFSMSVQRIHEDPRVTKPYTDEQWRQIEALGHQVDQRLISGDVRLTMGGEPTFVSIDDMDGEEWNTAANGHNKRRLAANLIHRLKDSFAPGGFLHFGQGKWYPGESLPRWAFSCYWRTDARPIWRDYSLLADETRNYGHTAAHAQQFTAALAERLQLAVKWIIPAFEETWEQIIKERRLPVNVDPLKADLKDPEERRRLARLLEQGLGEVVGYVLPLRRQWWQARPRWISGPWTLRHDELFLLSGDSPIGLRLPIASLPWVVPGKETPLIERDPLAPRPPLPEPAPRGQLRLRGQPGPGSGARNEQYLEEFTSHRDASAASSDFAPVIRTALCVEPRQGRLHVFMPPVETAEDYLDLLEAVEDTAEALSLPVVIEGYLPPHDHRLRHIKVTPDPGVIEVNIHPARSWDELVHNTNVVYEQARLSRLGTEKFMLDGRHSGTGGGNHVVLGGPTPADSPFLRRPDLLRSLVSYWNNHPSLSYLFSSLFIGPTSQSPRVDEGRRDAIYELQLACEQIPDRVPVAPWLVDRVFRNLLVDLTGNTHRAEFCIDKLYSPDSATGRLGLVEFRAFEMPPHPRMSLTQQLLVRALVARFWESPDHARLVRWGTALHDRFMLPHFLQQDFADVIADLQAFGISMQASWFAPHFEFRCPLMGEVTRHSVQIELRQALEPWYVLGEEPAGGGTARYVDSSVERLQVKVRGMTESRHVVACNGRRVPLHPTGTVGEFVAGVRYRAWQPPNCLHPTIPVHTPLVFDLVDTWNQRSIGGCKYHVAHPGGRSYATFPVNAYEAEGRRAARFFKMGHTGGPFRTPELEPNPDFPMTLDLRR